MNGEMARRAKKNDHHCHTQYGCRGYRSCGRSKAQNMKIRNRGFTDRLYFYNFCAVHIIVAAILIITALGGVLGLVDLSPLTNIPQWAYGELGLHTAFIVWKAKEENQRKYRIWTDKNKINTEMEEENL